MSLFSANGKPPPQQNHLRGLLLSEESIDDDDENQASQQEDKRGQDHHRHHHHADGDHLNCSHGGTTLSHFLPHGHSFSSYKGTHRQLLLLSLALFLLVAIGEFIAAWFAKSHTLILEALHVSMDSLSVLFALISSWIASKPPNDKATFGYSRAEVIAALLSVCVLFLLCILVSYHAVVSLIQTLIISTSAGSSSSSATNLPHPEVTPAQGEIIFVTMFIAIAVNVIVTIILSQDQQGNINIRAARAHAIADSVENVVVLIVGAMLWAKPSLWFLDPIVTILVMSMIVLANGGILWDAISVLMEFAPSHIDTAKLKQKISSLKGVRHVQALHAWTISQGSSMVAVIVSAGSDSEHSEDVVLHSSNAEILSRGNSADRAGILKVVKTGGMEAGNHNHHGDHHAITVDNKDDHDHDHDHDYDHDHDHDHDHVLNEDHDHNAACHRHHHRHHHHTGATDPELLQVITEQIQIVAKEFGAQEVIVQINH